MPGDADAATGCGHVLAYIRDHQSEVAVIEEPLRISTKRGFSELGALVPKRPARAVLGIADKDRYWLPMFGALAVAVAAGSTALSGPTSPRELSHSSARASRWRSWAQPSG